MDKDRFAETIGTHFFIYESSLSSPSHRFSQLLIDPNEIYFEDFLVDLVISKQISKKGRLKLCSKSLVFEPKDGKTPLIRILYKYCDQILKCSMNENSLKIK